MSEEEEKEEEGDMLNEGEEENDETGSEEEEEGEVGGGSPNVSIHLFNEGHTPVTAVATNEDDVEKGKAVKHQLGNRER